ncbi:MAG: prenyltransferase [Candidatus Thorarchaeota archaeon]
MSQNIFLRLRGPNIVGSALFVLTGFLFAVRETHSFDWIRAVLITLSMLCFNIYIWISNDFYDAPYDAEDELKGTRNVFCEQPDSREYKIGLGAMWLSLVGGLVIGFLAGWIYFAFTAVGMVLAYLYTSPTFRAKSRAGWDWLFHTVWFLISFLPLYLFIHGFNVIWGIEESNIQFYAVFLYIGLASLLGQINHQIPDYNIDKETGQMTTVVVLGVARTKQIRYIVYVLIASSTVVLFLITGSYIGLILILIYSLFLVFKTRNKDPADIRRVEDVPFVWIYFFILDYLILSPFILTFLS